MRYFKYIIIVFLIYLYIHNPLFSFMNGVGCKLIVDIIAVLYLLSKSNGFFRLYHKNNYSLFRCLTVLLIIELFFYVIYSNTTSLRIGCVSFLELYIVPASFVLFLRNNKITEYSFNGLILTVGMIGAVISTLCIAFPTINQYIKYSLTIIQEGSFIDVNSWRGFGMSDSLTSSYAIIQGIILVIGLYYFRTYKWFIFFMPLVLLSILFNARTGLFICIICLIIVILRSQSIGSFVRLSFLILIFFSVIINIMPNLSFDADAVEWLASGFDEFNSVKETGGLNDSLTLNTLFNEMFILPDSFSEWIWGTGVELFTRYGANSDIGFCNQLYYGGLLYCLPLYSIIVIVYKKLKTTGNTTFALIFIIVFFIANFKGRYLVNSGAFRFMLLYSISICYLSKNEFTKNSMSPLLSR